MGRCFWVLPILPEQGWLLPSPWGRLWHQGATKLCQYFLVKVCFHAKLLICFINCQIQQAKLQPCFCDKNKITA